MSFFARVLPAIGPFTVFTGVTGPDGKLAEQRHYNGLQSHEAIEKKIQELSTQPLNVFFAIGSYAGPNRRDPVAKRAVFLDLDSKDFDGSIENALRALSTFVRAVGLPPPSLYVHSGRGVHVYWCLDRDVPVAEWLPVAKALKAKCDELEFAADPSATADAARVLRAPGTLNRKGTTPLACRVLSDNGSVYSLEQLSKQLKPVIAGAAQKLAALAPADVLKTKSQYRDLKAEEVRAMLDVVHLPPTNNRDQWLMLLCAVQDWSDKSEQGWELFHEWCKTQPGYSSANTVRKEWDSFEPGGGITIGTLVKLALEAGYAPPGTPEPVAPASLQEQVEVQTTEGDEGDQPSVKSNISDPLMMTAQYAVDSLGKVRFDKNEAVQFLSNEFVIVTEQEDIYYSVTMRRGMTSRVIDNLLTRYMPLNSNGVPVEATKMMRRFGVKNSVQALGFHPTEGSIYWESNKTYVNQYTPPADLIQALPAEIALIEDFWSYMFPLPKDQDFSTYMRQSFGFLVQHPEIKIDSAPLIVSPEFGSGKTTLAWEIPRRLAGWENSQLVGNKVLRGQYSSFVNGTKFLHFDEVHINGRWDSDDTANALKSLVAGSTVEVHPKFMSPFNIPNRLYVSATSNYEDAMCLPTENERRWGVYAHRPTRQWTKQQKDTYFEVLYRWLKSPRSAGVLRWYFAQVDLTGFNPAAPPPLTDAKRRMVSKSQSKEVQVLADAAIAGDAPFDKDIITNDRVRQFLHAETGKVYTGYEVREFIMRAIPDAVTMPQLRVGQIRYRPICWRNKQHWMDPNRQPVEIKKELGA